MTEGGHNGAWYCSQTEERKTCPAQGCPKGHCEREHGWLPGIPEPDHYARPQPPEPLLGLNMTNPRADALLPFTAIIKGHTCQIDNIHELLRLINGGAQFTSIAARPQPPAPYGKVHTDGSRSGGMPPGTNAQPPAATPGTDGKNGTAPANPMGQPPAPITLAERAACAKAEETEWRPNVADTLTHIDALSGEAADTIEALRSERTDLQNTIARLTRELGEARDYSRQQAQRQSDDDEFRMMQRGYRGQD